jgi:hypothetical protein
MVKQTRSQEKAIRRFMGYLHRNGPAYEDGSRRLRLTVAEATVASGIADHAPGGHEVPLPVRDLDIRHPDTGGAAVDETPIPNVETYVGSLSAHLP